MKNTSMFALSEIAAKAINFILVPFYTHVLTTEQYGTADLVFTFSTLLSPLVMFSIGEAMMRFLLDKDADDSKIRHIEFLVIAFGFAVSLLSVPVIRCLPRVSRYAGYIYAYLVLCALREATVGYLRGKEKLFRYAVCNIVNTALVAGLNIYFLVGLKLGVRGYLLAYIIATGTTAVMAFILGEQYKGYRHSKIDAALLRSMVLFSIAVIPNSMMWWAINSSDHLMVSYMRGVEENGLLTVAYKIPALLTTFSTILMQGWKYSAISERGSADREEFNNRALDMFFRGMLLVSALLLLCNRRIVGLLYADAYFNSWRATSFLVFGNLFLSMGTFFGTSYYVEKKMQGNLLSAVIGAAANITLNALLIPRFGAAGATMAAAASYIIIMVYRYFDTRKYLCLRFWTPGHAVSMGLLLGLLVSSNLRLLWGSILTFCAIVLMNMEYIVRMAGLGRQLLLDLVRRRG